MDARLHALYERCPIPLQNLLVSLYGWKTRRERFDPDTSILLESLREKERRPAAEHAEAQVERLRELVEHAVARIPFYRERFHLAGVSPGQVRAASDLARLPVLRREDVHEFAERMIADDTDRRRLLPGHTSGTTGSPLDFWWDRRVCVWNNLMQLRVRSWAGWRDRDPTATLLGNVVVPSTQDHPPFWRTNRPWNKIFFSSFHLEPRHLPAYVRKLRSLGRVWFEAYPSTAFVLAQHLAETRDTLPLAGVFLSSETLTRSARALIEERFDTRVWDSYSLSERVLFAGECEAHDGQHLCPEFGIVEILDENDQPVPPGQPGRVVATGLQNFAMPLIRYDTGDVGGLDPRPCPCGRTLPRMPPITTKAEDVVRTPEGRLISASVLTHPFKPLHSIGRSQILQDAPDHVLVRIVPRPTYGPEDERALRAGLRQRLGPSMRIDVETVDDIPRTRAGKYRWVVSRVPLGFGPAAATNLFWSEDDPS